MNKTQFIKIALMEVVRTNAQFDKKTKLELFEFVKTASLKDLKVLITEEVLTVLTAAALSAMLIKTAYDVHREYFSKAAKLCKNTKWDSIERHLCIIGEEIKGRQRQISSLKSSTSKCSKLDSPFKQNKCKGLIAKEVNQLESKIIKLKQEKNVYEKRLAKKKL